MDCEDQEGYEDCPGCQECGNLHAALETTMGELGRTSGERSEAIQECERLKSLGKRMCQALGISTDMDEEALVKACEQLRTELESERKESAYWRNVEAPIMARDNIALREACEQLRARLVKAERVVRAVRKYDTASMPTALRLVDTELDEALAEWESENG